MRTFEERKAEIFLRSENRIKQRRKNRRRILSVCIPLCVILIVGSVALPRLIPVGDDRVEQENSFEIKDESGDKLDYIVNDEDGFDGIEAAPESDGFSFSLTWGCYGISSYDSATGRLVKTSDATHPEDYVTTYYLTDEQKQEIYNMIVGLDIEKYPDEYNPHKNAVSTPYMTLILSVKANGIEKTVTVPETALSYDANNRKGQKFLDVCKAIEDILTATQEWKALPEYEFFYD